MTDLVTHRQKNNPTDVLKIYRGLNTVNFKWSGMGPISCATNPSIFELALAHFLVFIIHGRTAIVKVTEADDLVLFM